MAQQIKLQYQVKHTEYRVGNNVKETYEVRELLHDCDPKKDDIDNFDDAYLKACELGADPNKNMRWRFITN